MEVLFKDRPWSTVWRVERDGETLWRKRCKSLWLFEPRLTVALATRWPDRMPEVVDHGDDWLLLRDSGTAVENLPNAHDVWLEAIARYSELQRGEVSRVEEHLAAGVPDQRVHVLPAEYQAMLIHDELPWRPGQRDTMRRFERRFGELCEELGTLASIQHDDLHIHNVYEGPRILDWGDSCVAHPFFSLVVTFMFVPEGQEEIRAAYLEAFGGDGAELALALRVGRIAHVFKWIRFRDVLPAHELAAYDGHFVGWLDQAVAQTSE